MINLHLKIEKQHKSFLAEKNAVVIASPSINMYHTKTNNRFRRRRRRVQGRRGISVLISPAVEFHLFEQNIRRIAKSSPSCKENKRLMNSSL